MVDQTARAPSGKHLGERHTTLLEHMQGYLTHTWYWASCSIFQVCKSDLGFGVGVKMEVVVVGEEIQKSVPEEVWLSGAGAWKGG